MKKKHPLESYYKFHSKIYDATRWSFLFGRDELINEIAKLEPQTIGEIGSGTGRNLLKLSDMLPQSKIIGIEPTTPMNDIAKVKLEHSSNCHLIENFYSKELFPKSSFQVMMMSYTFTMIQEHKESILESVFHHLVPHGKLFILDFHRSPFDWFSTWMKMNHVTFNLSFETLIPKYGKINRFQSKKAYGGLWKYVFIEVEKIA